jgi:hypothetical protein
MMEFSFCPTMSAINQSILELRAAVYDIEDMVDVNDYLGINFQSSKWRLLKRQLLEITARLLSGKPFCPTRTTPEHRFFSAIEATQTGGTYRFLFNDNNHVSIEMILTDIDEKLDAI